MNPDDRYFRLLALALGLLAFLAVVLTVSDYGLVYDEPVYLHFGQYKADWITDVVALRWGQAFTRDSIEQAWRVESAGVQDMQPPFEEVLSGVSQRVLGPVAVRLPTALLFGVAVTALALLLAGVAGRAAGLFGALAFALSPRVFADAHYATLDLPVTALVVLTTATALRLGRTPNTLWTVITGAAFGLGLLCKLNAMILAPALLVWFAVFRRPALWRLAIALAIVGPAVFWLGWPWLWFAPVGRTAAYLAFHLRHYPINTYYLGRLYAYAPWHYPFVMTAVTVPLAFLLFAVDGFAVGLVRVRQRPEPLLFVLGAGAYLVAFALPTTPKYDGVRLFLPAMAFVAALAGIGLGALAAALPPLFRSETRPWLIGTAIGVLCLPAVAALVRINPYPLAYYNELAGGPRGARAKGFETVYWGGPYYGALKYLNAQSRPGDLVYVTPAGVIDTLFRVYQRAGACRDDLRFTASAADLPRVNWVLLQTAQGEFGPESGPDAVAWPLYRRGWPREVVARAGAPLALLYTGEEARHVLSGPRGQRSGLLLESPR